MPRLASAKSCYTCRRRKIKCDEAMPQCARCVKAGYDCDRSSRLTFKQVTVGNTPGERDGPRIHLEEPHIAHLFHVYLRDLAPWYDLNDQACAFARKAAVLALDDMLLFSAIIALAGHYTAKKLCSSIALAESYHERCLKLLINLSPTDEAVQNGIALATTCLLRSYEIISEDTDPNRHLFGASTLLPSKTPDLEDDSLLASGFWNYLREDITYSLIHGCELKIRMDRLFRGIVTPENLSNVMTLFVAHAINLYFGNQDDFQQVQTLEAEIDACWQTYRPEPFAYQSRNLDGFPTIKMLSDTDAAAWHYHKVAKCVISTADRIDLAPEVCGLAMSSMSDPVVVNAYGPICFVGRWLQTVSQRNTLVKWLHDTQKRTAWNVDNVVQNLRRAWAEEIGTTTTTD